ncbi:MAG: hypothetical protein AAFY84_08365 [Pseudomonadota bacterium]
MRQLCLAATTTAALAFATSGAYAIECATIFENDELEDVFEGDIVYEDIDAKKPVRIRSIDYDLEEICGRKDCFSTDELYTSDAVTVCTEEGKNALGMGVIYLYGDQDEEENDEEEASEE